MRPALPIVLVLALLAPSGAVEAAPVDAKVGDQRAVFRREGTTLRAEPKPLGKPVIVLPPKKRVTVEAVSLPWLQVRASVDGQIHRGWLKALETVEAAALSANTSPLRRSSTGTGEISRRDASAASRQLDADTEARYRAKRTDLRSAYAAVDALERETASIEPIDAIAFIMDARLGRRGRDYDRPPLAKPTRQEQRRTERRERSNPGGLLGKIGGEIAERLGAGKREAEVAAKALGSAAEMANQIGQRFTPEQEYYLGRAVAAEAIAKFGVDPDAERRAYVRMVGEAVVRLTDRLLPTFGGYHFEVLDSDGVNGVSGPGGFVLITRGAVELCQTEDELAGILAHELGHIRLKHGEAVLRKGKSFQAMVKGLAETGATATGVDDDAFAGKLVSLLGSSASEIVRTSTENGYGRQLEFQADKEGTYTLFDVYYDQAALRETLLRLQARNPERGHSATHASPGLRAETLVPVLAPLPPFSPRDGVRERRRERFTEAAK